MKLIVETLFLHDYQYFVDGGTCTQYIVKLELKIFCANMYMSKLV